MRLAKSGLDGAGATGAGAVGTCPAGAGGFIGLQQREGSAGSKAGTRGLCACVSIEQTSGSARRADGGKMKKDKSERKCGLGRE